MAVKAEAEESERGDNDETPVPVSKRARRGGLKLLCGLCDTEADTKGQNWGSTTTDDRGIARPDGLLCRLCTDFAAESGLQAEEVVARRKKDATFREAIDEDREEYATNRGAGGEPSEFEPEDVRYEVVVSSELREQYGFMSRQAFKAQHKVFPDEARLSQIRALNRHGQEEVGIAIDLGVQPILNISTTRRYVRSQPVLRHDKHYYKRQADRVFTGRVEKAARTLGQNSGDKYVGKKKAVTVYTQADIDQHLQELVDKRKVGSRASGIAQMDSNMVCDPSDEESDTLPEEESTTAPPVPLANTTCSIASSSCDGPATTPKFKKSWSFSPSVKQEKNPRMRMKSPADKPASLTVSVGGEGVSEEGAAGASIDGTPVAEDDSATERTKPPSYWMQVLCVNEALKGTSFENRLRFARNCVSRTTRAGREMEASHPSATLSSSLDFGGKQKHSDGPRAKEGVTGDSLNLPLPPAVSCCGKGGANRLLGNRGGGFTPLIRSVSRACFYVDGQWMPEGRRPCPEFTLVDAASL